jgi:hypothetical protein
MAVEAIAQPLYYPLAKPPAKQCNFGVGQSNYSQVRFHAFVGVPA